MKLLLPLALVAALAVAAPACGEDEQAQDAPPPPGPNEGFVDGVLTAVSDQQLTLRTTDGDEVVFGVRPIDARRLDLMHLQLHARDQLPSRVYYERDGGTAYATRVYDL